MNEGMQSSLFVGRRQEIATLVALMRRAGEGEPGFAVVVGEAGIGKTRLVSELAGHAAEAGFTVLVGHCAELGAEGLPLAPLIDALRALARTMAPGDLADVLGPARRGLGRLLPELDPDVAGAGGLAADAFAQAPTDGIRLGQLLELLLAVLARITARQPLMLVIEDLHWADQSTRELVAFLVRSLRGIPVLLLVTYRSDELTRKHPLRQLIASWERLRMVTRVELHRFSRDEVNAQLGGIFAFDPAGDVVDLILDRSGGNAYLVEELAGLVRAGGGSADLPPPLRDVLLSRVDSLSEGAQRLVRAAAVAGRSVSDGLLAEISGVAGAEFYGGLREAVESHLLVVDHTGRGYAFRHALTRDAVYEDLLPGERVALHVAYGNALSREPALASDDAAVPAALAHHWYAALDLPRALPASIAAARHALTSFAAAEAQMHLERALEIWPRVPDAEQQAGMDQAQVASLAGEAAYWAGHIDRSLALLDQALALLPAHGDAIRRALLLEHRARALRESGRETEAIVFLEQALALLPADQVTREHAILLSSLAASVLRTSDVVTAERLAARAVQVACQAGAAQQEADACISLGLARCYLSAGAEGLDDLRAGLAQAVETGFPAIALRGYVNLSDALGFVGRHDEATHVAREGIALADRVGMSRTLGTFLVGNLGHSLVSMGRWDEAERLAAQAFNAMPEGVFGIGVLVCRAELAAMRGRYQEADANLRAARRWLSHGTGDQYTLPVRYIGALVAVGQGDLGLARRLATEKLVADGSPLAARFLWPLLWMTARVEADEAILIRDQLEEIPASSSARWDELAGLARGLAVQNPAWGGYRALVRAELSRAEGKHDVAAWSAAADVWRAVGAPYPLAYSLLRLAEAAAVTGDRQRASVSVSQAHAVASEVGAAPLADEAAALARRARLRLPEPDEQAPVAPPVDPLARFGLTEREREVVALVAAGRTNAQIAKALFISPRTAGVHVTNILRKLGVSGRVEAAAVAERAGLLESRQP
jgi:DNA-binding CsgD family transcriptional regulator/tetratricopeptide (TPR) repeat protein